MWRMIGDESHLLPRYWESSYLSRVDEGGNPASAAWVLGFHALTKRRVINGAE